VGVTRKVVPTNRRWLTVSNEDAVFIGEQATGTTVVIGREDREEWIRTDDMTPLEVAEYR
jgi:hypothetical protein